MKVVTDFVRERRESMNQKENYRYWLFRKVKGVKFGTRYSGVSARIRRSSLHVKYVKESYVWEFGDLYFDLPEQETRF